MPSAALELLGLWLRSQGQKKCLSLVREWRKALIGKSPAANDNPSGADTEAKLSALRQLDRFCAACERSCVNRPPAPPWITVKVVRALEPMA